MNYDEEELKRVCALYKETPEEFLKLMGDEFQYQLTVCSSVEEAVDETHRAYSRKASFMCWGESPEEWEGSSGS